MRMHRAETLERLHREQVDLLVIGAGIVGARIAFEAARSGLRVALVDAGDFGGATSSASSKLVHGGFRYLPMGDVGLIRQSQQERRMLLDVVAPNLVRPMPFLLPAYGESSTGPATVAAGLVLYRALAGRGGHVGWVSESTARALVPPIRIDGMRTCGLFEEAETIDSRLVLATVKAAAASGAIVLNRRHRGRSGHPDGASRATRDQRGRAVGGPRATARRPERERPRPAEQGHPRSAAARPALVGRRHDAAFQGACCVGHSLVGDAHAGHDRHALRRESSRRPRS